MNEIKSYNKFLTIDYGRKRIGLAVCDEFHITITPLETIANNDNIYQKLKEIIKKHNIQKIVLGYPSRNDDKNIEFQNEILSFKDKIEDLLKLVVIIFDESYSSKKAVQTLIEIGKKKSKRKEKSEIDKVSAAIILKEFLETSESKQK